MAEFQISACYITISIDFAIPASNRWTTDQLPTTIQEDKMKLTKKYV